LSILKPNTFIQEVNSLGAQFWISTTAGAYCFSEDLKPMYDGHCFLKTVALAVLQKIGKEVIGLQLWIKD
jgi:hypothetical protein